MAANITAKVIRVKIKAMVYNQSQMIMDAQKIKGCSMRSTTEKNSES